MQGALRQVKEVLGDEAIILSTRKMAAAVVGSLQVAEGLKKNQPATIVTILCDSGDKYLSERFWDEG